MSLGFRMDRSSIGLNEPIGLNIVARNDSSTAVKSMRIQVKQVTRWTARGHGDSKTRTVASMVVPGAQLGALQWPSQTGNDRGQGMVAVAAGARQHLQEQLSSGTGTRYQLLVPGSSLLTFQTTNISVSHTLGVELDTSFCLGAPCVWTPLRVAQATIAGTEVPPGVPNGSAQTVPYPHPQQGAAMPYPKAQQGGVVPYPNPLQGGVVPYLNAEQGGAVPYPNAQQGGVVPFPNPQHGAAVPYPNPQQGAVVPYPNTQQGGVVPYHNAQQGGFVPYTNAQQGVTVPYPNAQQGEVVPYTISQGGVVPYPNAQGGAMTYLSSEPGPPPVTFYPTAEAVPCHSSTTEAGTFGSDKTGAVPQRGG